MKSISINKIISHKKQRIPIYLYLNLSACIKKPNGGAFVFMQKEISSYLLLFRHFKWQCGHDDMTRTSNDLYMWRKLCNFSNKNKRRRNNTSFFSSFSQLQFIYKSLYSFPFLLFYFSLFLRNKRNLRLFSFGYCSPMFNKNWQFNLVLFILNLVLQCKKSKYSLSFFLNKNKNKNNKKRIYVSKHHKVKIAEKKL